MERREARARGVFGPHRATVEVPEGRSTGVAVGRVGWAPGMWVASLNWPGGDHTLGGRQGLEGDALERGRIIGIDCATRPAKIGLALGRVEGATLFLEEARKVRSWEAVGRTIAGWIGSEGPTLLAVDAPLGWPAPLGPALAAHHAGEALAEEANQLFRRETDRFIKSQIGRMPLDVGADRIARTARAALELLADVRRLSGEPIPLAWQPGFLQGTSAIEVYPAATLVALALSANGYKGQGDGDRRRLLLDGVVGELKVPDPLTDLLAGDADLLDAAFCVLAGFDFWRGRVYRPTDLPRARREGWIWARSRIDAGPPD